MATEGVPTRQSVECFVLSLDFLRLYQPTHASYTGRTQDIKQCECTIGLCSTQSHRSMLHCVNPVLHAGQRWV